MEQPAKPNVRKTLDTTALSSGFSDAQWLGAGAAFLSALTGAFCSVHYRPFLQRYPTLQIGSLAMVSATFFLGLLAISEGFFAAWPDYSLGVGRRSSPSVW